MKKSLAFLLCFFFLGQEISFAANTPTLQTTQESKSNSTTKTPDFSPPKDLKGPVFPPEEIILPPNPETNRFLNEFVNMMATLGLIISFILLFAWFLKRMLTSRQEQANVSSFIKVIERRSLSPKTAVYLLEIEGQSIVISESQNGVTHLATYDSPEEVDEPKELPSAFNKLLNSKDT